MIRAKLYSLAGACLLVLTACGPGGITGGGNGELPGADAGTLEASTASIPRSLTSARPAKGSAWRTMREHGFTGGLQAGCTLMGLTNQQCMTAAENHSAGRCVTRDFKDANGSMVLDTLTFTRGGVHRVQKQVKVDLVNPPSWLVDICSAGDGVFVLRFHGCDNFASIRVSPTSATTRSMSAPAQPPVVATGDQLCIFVDSAEPSFIKARVGKSLTSQVLHQYSAQQMKWRQKANGRYEGEFCYPRHLSSTPGGFTLCSTTENNWLDANTLAYIAQNGGVGREDPAVLAY